ncbi:MAG: hypothetical protein K2Q21_07950 [Chitinophagaceae bacterium]|nr:hypothetical protein [Chitinophagaceae bacterium]
MTQKIYSYILRHDSGAAPNPFWDICTLTICKPAIRRTAEIGDWIIGTGSKKTRVTKNDTIDISDGLVYAMKVTDKKNLKDYNEFCNEKLQNKIPVWRTADWRLRMGDCVYDYSNDGEPILRKSVHDETNRATDTGGIYTLLSTHFYYFGLAAVQIPNELKKLIKHGPGHKIIQQDELINKFESWIGQFQLRTVFADPQLRWLFDKGVSDDTISETSKQDYDDDKDESCETVC